MEYYAQKAQQQQLQQQQQLRSSFESKMEGHRVQNRTTFDAAPSTSAATNNNNNPHRHNGGGAEELRASFDARDLSSRASLDIKDVVRASFQRERSRSTVDGRDGGLRESPRFGGGGDRSRYNKDPPRSSVDGGSGGGGGQPVRPSMDSPRLSMRIKEAVRAVVEGRLDSVRSSFDSRDSVQKASSTTSNRSRETPTHTPRSSSTDSRLLVELRESPRLSRDAPRYSCDGRDVLRCTPAVENSTSNNYISAASKESLRAVVQKARESPRLSVDGRGGGPPPPSAAVPAAPPPGDGREPPLVRELLHVSSRESSHYQSYPGMRSEIDGKDQQQQQSGAEPRRRVPSLVARLMGLEDLPDEIKQTQASPSQQMATSVAAPRETMPAVGAQPQHIPVAPQKKPSKESKLLKGLLQYNNPRAEEPRSGSDSRHGEAHQSQDQVKHMFGSKHQQQAENVVAAAAAHHPHQPPPPPSVWNGANQQEASPRQLKLSPKQLGLETMPSALKQQQQEAREMGVLRQKVVQAMPKQLTEAVLTVLKNADDNKRMPMSYADMESRLRQLRLRSSLQEHKTLRQILEAMQSKGLLSGASRSKEGYMDQEARQQQEEARPQQDSRYQNTPKQIMLPKPQEYTLDASSASKMRNLQELKRMGSTLHEQVFGSMTEESVKPLRPHAQSVSAKVVRSPDEQQQSTSGASIVVMKPIVKPAKKTSGRAQNPALFVESMPSARSSRRDRETGGRTSPWGSPVNRSSRSQPGFGFGRESTGRFNSEEGAAFKVRREKILARAGTRDVQSEPATPRPIKLIALPQSTAKLRSSSASKEASESLRHLKTNSTAGKNGESGRRVVRSSAKEETSRTAPGISSRSQSSRDLLGAKKSASNVPEPERLRRSSSDGKMSYERDSTHKSTGPAEVIILRNRSSMAKRVTLLEPDSRSSTTTNTTTTKRIVTNGGAKSPGGGEKTKERASPGSAPTTPRSPAKNTADHARKKEEQGGVVLDHVRVTNGDALDQSNVRSPLVGLTNRLQSTEIGLGELEREGQGVRTPRAAAILVKKILSNQEGNLVAEIIDSASEQPQPSPVSVLDPASFREEDVSPLALNKSVDGMQGQCDNERGNDVHTVQQADTALQEWWQQVRLAEDPSPVGECSPQLIFLRESAKILPPQGEVKPLILPSQASEKVYVRDILVVSGATMGMKAFNPGGGMIDSSVFDYLEEKQGTVDYGMEQKAETVQDSEMCEGEKERQVLDRRMLFDCVNDALTTLLVPYVNSQPWMEGLHPKPLQKRPTGQRLVQQLWDELKFLPPQSPCEDICDSLYTVLQKDLVRPRNSWTEFSDEVEDIGLEVEKMIFKDLIEETLCDLAQSGVRKEFIAL